MKQIIHNTIATITVLTAAAIVGGILTGLSISNKSMEDLIWILYHK